jgi:NADH-quinone oxidoreductase subunit K
MSIEIMFNAAGLAFIAGGARWGNTDGQVMFLLILAVAAAEVAVGLAIVLQLYHRFNTLDTDAARSLRG